MKLRKKIEISLVAALGISLMLLIGLLAHFAMSQPLDRSRLEMSKFEFQKPLSATDKIEIKMLLHSITGMRRDIIINHNSVVCFHDAHSYVAQQIIQKLGSNKKYKAYKILNNKRSNTQLAPIESRGKLHQLAIAIRSPL